MKNDEISQKNRALFLSSLRIKRKFPQAFYRALKYHRHDFSLAVSIFVFLIDNHIEK